MNTLSKLIVRLVKRETIEKVRYVYLMLTEKSNKTTKMQIILLLVSVLWIALNAERLHVAVYGFIGAGVCWVLYRAFLQARLIRVFRSIDAIYAAEDQAQQAVRFLPIAPKPTTNKTRRLGSPLGYLMSIFVFGLFLIVGTSKQISYNRQKSR